MLKNRTVLECVAQTRRRDEGPALFDAVFTDCLLSLCVSDARASQHIKFDGVRTVFSHKEEGEGEQASCVRAYGRANMCAPFSSRLKPNLSIVKPISEGYINAFCSVMG